MSVARSIFRRSWPAFVFCVLGALTAAGAPALPYRFLLVIQDQWQDPASELMPVPTEFSTLCALMRSWGLPFDIYRLDQEHLDAYHLLDRDGRSRYGTIIWDAPRATLDDVGADLLRELVVRQGVGLVALGAGIDAPVISQLAGLEASGAYDPGTEELRPTEHFITRGVVFTAAIDPSPVKLRRGEIPGRPPAKFQARAVRLSDAQAVVARGEHPVLTVRPTTGAGQVVWLDSEPTRAGVWPQAMRDLFKRSLVWVNGYALVAEYPRSVILFMDDMGSSDKTYYSEWHYPTLSEAVIRHALIEPLQRHGAVMVQNVNTGFVDRRTHRVLNPWRQEHVVDELDPTIIHDFASTKRGLEAGVKAGVFDLESHGWTHMAPDLDSPPGPFWSAMPQSAVVQLNWYKEFGDTARDREVPAITQRLHLQRALECMAEDFGVRPVSMRCGGTQGSDSFPNNTMRVAAKLGFGIGQADYIYCLGDDYCLPLNPVSRVFALAATARLRAAEVPWSRDAPVWIGCHDRDVALDPEFYARLLDDLGAGVRYLTCAEYCGYLHAAVSRPPAPEGHLSLQVQFDERYGSYFKTHPSTWVLYVNEPPSASAFSPDERQVVQLAPGLEPHRVTVRLR